MKKNKVWNSIEGANAQFLGGLGGRPDNARGIRKHTTEITVKNLLNLEKQISRYREVKETSKI